MKRKLVLFLFLTFFLLPFNVNAKEAFDIKNYDVDVVVGIDNTLKIMEDITVFFNEPRHGIIRKIPYNGSIKRIDGSRSKFRAKIKNIVVNEKSSVSSEDNYKLIQIGDANKLVDGLVNYKISYTYDLGRDKNKSFDELYLNIIGPEWDTTIDEVTFNISMPKVYDKEKLGFSLGSYGSSGYNEEDIEFIQEGNNISGRTKVQLGNYEGLTVRIELPDKYFEREDNLAFLNIVFIGISIYFASLSLHWWKKYGVDREVIETVEFYPPIGMNSAEVGFAYSLTSNDNAVVSLLIYLANKGYLRIEEKDTKGKDFKIIKVKEYDGNNENERLFFDGLFKNKDIVEKKDLEESFYKVIATIKFNLEKDRFKYSEKKSSKLRLGIIGTSLLTLLCSLIKPLIEGYEIDFVILSVVFVLLFVGIVAALFAIIKRSALFVSIISLILAFLASWLVAYSYLFDDMVLSLVFMIGFISIIIQFISFAYMGKRTIEGAQILGKLKGFKNFLKVAEKEKLETLVLDDPSYFYNILPYTYVFGLSNKWIKKFESIAISPPDWYTSSNPDMFDIYVFNRFMDNTLVSAQSAMTSMPQGTSGGSGYSGGGFSGGGVGGGGGSSW